MSNGLPNFSGTSQLLLERLEQAAVLHAKNRSLTDLVRCCEAMLSYAKGETESQFREMILRRIHDLEMGHQHNALFLIAIIRSEWSTDNQCKEAFSSVSKSPNLEVLQLGEIIARQANLPWSMNGSFKSYSPSWDTYSSTAYDCHRLKSYTRRNEHPSVANTPRVTPDSGAVNWPEGVDQGTSFLNFVDAIIAQGFRDGAIHIRYHNRCARLFDSLPEPLQDKIRAPLRKKLLAVAKQESAPSERNVAVGALLNLGERVLSPSTVASLFDFSNDAPRVLKEDEPIEEQWDALERSLRDNELAMQELAESLLEKEASTGREHAVECALTRLNEKPDSVPLGRFARNYMKEDPESLRWIVDRCPSAISNSLETLTLVCEIAIDGRLSDYENHIKQKLSECLWVTPHRERIINYLQQRLYDGSSTAAHLLTAVTPILEDSERQEILSLYRKGDIVAGEILASQPNLPAIFQNALLEIAANSTQSSINQFVPIISSLPIGSLSGHEKVSAIFALLREHVASQEYSYHHHPAGPGQFVRAVLTLIDPSNIQEMRRLVSEICTFKGTDQLILDALSESANSFEEVILVVEYAAIAWSEGISLKSLSRAVQNHPATIPSVRAILEPIYPDIHSLVFEMLGTAEGEVFDELAEDDDFCRQMAARFKIRNHADKTSSDCLGKCLALLPAFAEEINNSLDQPQRFPEFIAKLPVPYAPLVALMLDDLERAITEGSIVQMRAEIWEYQRYGVLKCSDIRFIKAIKAFPQLVDRLESPSKNSSFLSEADLETMVGHLEGYDKAIFKILAIECPSSVPNFILPRLIQVLEQGGEALRPALHWFIHAAKETPLDAQLKHALLESIICLAKEHHWSKNTLSLMQAIVRVLSGNERNQLLLKTISNLLFEWNQTSGSHLSFKLLAPSLAKTPFVYWLAVMVCHEKQEGGYTYGNHCARFLRNLLPEAETDWLARFISILDTDRFNTDVRIRVPIVASRMTYAVLDQSEMLDRICRVAKYDPGASENFITCIAQLESDGVRFFGWKEMAIPLDKTRAEAEPPPLELLNRYRARHCYELAAEIRA
jgi:hypothetical protein